MRWLKQVAILTIFVLCFLCLLSCSRKTESSSKEVVKQEKKIEIGFIFDSFILERWQRDRDAFVETAEQKLGANVTIENANGDVKEQERLINEFITKKVDVLVIVAIDSEAVTDAVKRAKESGIKVIAYDRLIKNGNVDLYISFDNKKVGTLMAQSIKANTKEDASVFMMCGAKGDNNVSLVQQGFLSELKDGKCKVEDTKYATGWRSESGYEELNTYLATHKTLDAVMCGNDGIAGQVIHALSEHRLAGKVCVVGQDADLDACQRIVEGTQTMTVYKPIPKLASLAAIDAVALAKGEEIKDATTCSDGLYQIPYIGLTPIAITKDTMDTVINDGFHSRDEIYLNINK